MAESNGTRETEGARSKPGIPMPGMGGIQEWLSFYPKSPMTPPEHDLSIRPIKLGGTPRTIMGERVVHHTGPDYYE